MLDPPLLVTLLVLIPIMFYYGSQNRFWALIFCGPFRVSQMTITHIFSKTTTPIDPVFCHHTAYSRPTKRCF